MLTSTRAVGVALLLFLALTASVTHAKGAGESVDEIASELNAAVDPKADAGDDHGVDVDKLADELNGAADESDDDADAASSEDDDVAESEDDEHLTADQALGDELADELNTDDESDADEDEDPVADDLDADVVEAENADDSERALDDATLRQDLSELRKTAPAKWKWLKSQWQWMKKAVLRVKARSQERAQAKARAQRYAGLIKRYTKFARRQRTPLGKQLRMAYIKLFKKYQRTKKAYLKGCKKNSYYLRLSKWHWKHLIKAHSKLADVTKKYVAIRKKYAALDKKGKAALLKHKNFLSNKVKKLTAMAKKHRSGLEQAKKNHKATTQKVKALKKSLTEQGKTLESAIQKDLAISTSTGDKDAAKFSKDQWAWLQKQWRWMRSALGRARRLKKLTGSATRLEDLRKKFQEHELEHTPGRKAVESAYLKLFNQYRHLERAWVKGCRKGDYWLRLSKWHWSHLLRVHKRLAKTTRKFSILRRRLANLPKRFAKHWTKWHHTPLFKKSKFLSKVMAQSKKKFLTAKDKARRDQKYLAQVKKAVEKQAANLKLVLDHALKQQIKLRSHGKTGLNKSQRAALRRKLKKALREGRHNVAALAARVKAGKKIQILPYMRQKMAKETKAIEDKILNSFNKKLAAKRAALRAKHAKTSSTQSKQHAAEQAKHAANLARARKSRMAAEKRLAKAKELYRKYKIAEAARIKAFKAAQRRWAAAAARAKAAAAARDKAFKNKLSAHAKQEAVKAAQRAKQEAADRKAEAAAEKKRAAAAKKLSALEKQAIRNAKAAAAEQKKAMASIKARSKTNAKNDKEDKAADRRRAAIAAAARKRARALRANMTKAAAAAKKEAARRAAIAARAKARALAAKKRAEKLRLERLARLAAARALAAKKKAEALARRRRQSIANSRVWRVVSRGCNMSPSAWRRIVKGVRAGADFRITMPGKTKSVMNVDRIIYPCNGWNTACFYINRAESSRVTNLGMYIGRHGSRNGRYWMGTPVNMRNYQTFITGTHGNRSNGRFCPIVMTDHRFRTLGTWGRGKRHMTRSEFNNLRNLAYRGAAFKVTLHGHGYGTSYRTTFNVHRVIPNCGGNCMWFYTKRENAQGKHQYATFGWRVTAGGAGGWSQNGKFWLGRAFRIKNWQNFFSGTNGAFHHGTMRYTLHVDSRSFPVFRPRRANQPIRGAAWARLKKAIWTGDDVKIGVSNRRHMGVIPVSRIIPNCGRGTSCFYANRASDNGVVTWGCANGPSTRSSGRFWIGTPTNTRSRSQFATGTSGNIQSGSLGLDYYVGIRSFKYVGSFGNGKPLNAKTFARLQYLAKNGAGFKVRVNAGHGTIFRVTRIIPECGHNGVMCLHMEREQAGASYVDMTIAVSRIRSRVWWWNTAAYWIGSPRYNGNINHFFGHTTSNRSHGRAGTFQIYVQQKWAVNPDRVKADNGKRCWMKLSCPKGWVRRGDGSACQPKKGGKSCDLGYCANAPNGGMPRCSCWHSLPCPKGWVRRGDGSACSPKRGGGQSCDLGHCANKPNKGMEKCSDVMSKKCTVDKAGPALYNFVTNRLRVSKRNSGVYIARGRASYERLLSIPVRTVRRGATAFTVQASIWLTAQSSDNDPKFCLTNGVNTQPLACVCLGDRGNRAAWVIGGRYNKGNHRFSSWKTRGTIRYSRTPTYARVTWTVRKGRTHLRLHTNGKTTSAWFNLPQFKNGAEILKIMMFRNDAGESYLVRRVQITSPGRGSVCDDKAIVTKIHVPTQDAGCHARSAYTVTGAPVNERRGSGWVINAKNTRSGYAMHDHKYVRSYVPNPNRAQVWMRFNKPVTVSSVRVVEHQNGVSILEGFAGDSLNNMQSMGTVTGNLGAPRGGSRFREGSSNTFKFPNPKAGRYFKVVIRQTTLHNGWALYRIIPTYTNANEQCAVAATGKDLFNLATHKAPQARAHSNGVYVGSGRASYERLMTFPVNSVRKGLSSYDVEGQFWVTAQTSDNDPKFCLLNGMASQPMACVCLGDRGNRAAWIIGGRYNSGNKRFQSWKTRATIKYSRTPTYAKVKWQVRGGRTLVTLHTNGKTVRAWENLPNYRNAGRLRVAMFRNDAGEKYLVRRVKISSPGVSQCGSKAGACVPMKIKPRRAAESAFKKTGYTHLKVWRVAGRSCIRSRNSRCKEGKAVGSTFRGVVFNRGVKNVYTSWARGSMWGIANGPHSGWGNMPLTAKFTKPVAMVGFQAFGPARHLTAQFYAPNGRRIGRFKWNSRPGRGRPWTGFTGMGPIGRMVVFASGGFALTELRFGGDAKCMRRETKINTCKTLKERNPNLRSGYYTMQLPGQTQKTRVYCDMRTMGGGWTLVGQAVYGVRNFYNLRVGGGSWKTSPRGRNVWSIPKSFAVAQVSSDIMIARSNSNNFGGDASSANAASYFKLPDAKKTTFANPSHMRRYNKGPCIPVKVYNLKGSSCRNGCTRYTFKYSVGTTWTDTFPTGVGTLNTRNCVNGSLGPMATTDDTGTGNPRYNGRWGKRGTNSGAFSYWHRAWWDVDRTSQGGQQMIFLR